MKLIALDSSGLVASAAVLSDNELLAEYTVNYKKTHSQTLLPMLDEISNMINLDLGEVDAVAIAAGPGSFTGLRIGSATAKGLGMALNKPLVSVPTLEGLAANLWGRKEYICPMMDARRKQVYTGIYRFGREGLQVVEDQMACPVEKILEICRQLKEEIVFLGDGVPVYLDIIESTRKNLMEQPDWTYAPAGSGLELWEDWPWTTCVRAGRRKRRTMLPSTCVNPRRSVN